ncbi:cyclic pyranopterin monophosphate synthase MoaC [Thalassotalea ganghwensis]
MLTHVNQSGQANMVDVSDKAITSRVAVAEGYIKMNAETIAAINDNNNKKGDVIATARIAGIQAAKKCSELIPLCHPLALTKVSVEFEIDTINQQVKVTTLCKLAGKTGVEMEALTAASVTLLTLFDMCKASDPTMEIYGIKVVAKKGGKSGDWQRDE